MNMKVLRIGSETDAGNCTLVMRSSEGLEIEGIEVFGGPLYRMIVSAESVKRKGYEYGSEPADFSFSDFPMGKFEVEEREHTFPDDHPVEELRGETRNYRWLNLQ